MTVYEESETFTISGGGSSGQKVAPVGAKHLKVALLGGGGGGGGGAFTRGSDIITVVPIIGPVTIKEGEHFDSPGGGGGSGGMLRASCDVKPGQSFYYSVGAGGSRGTYTGDYKAQDLWGSDGARGGDTTFGPLLASGGFGGQGGRTSDTQNSYRSPGVGGGGGYIQGYNQGWVIEAAYNGVAGDTGVNEVNGGAGGSSAEGAYLDVVNNQGFYDVLSHDALFFKSVNINTGDKYPAINGSGSGGAGGCDQKRYGTEDNYSSGFIGAPGRIYGIFTKKYVKIKIKVSTEDRGNVTWGDTEYKNGQDVYLNGEQTESTLYYMSTFSYEIKEYTGSYYLKTKFPIKYTFDDSNYNEISASGNEHVILTLEFGSKTIGPDVICEDVDANSISSGIENKKIFYNKDFSRKYSAWRENSSIGTPSGTDPEVKNTFNFIQDASGNYTCPVQVLENGVTAPKSLNFTRVWSKGKLGSVKISNEILRLGSNLFRDEASLQSVTFYDPFEGEKGSVSTSDLESIGSSTFSGCAALKTFATPSSVSTIGSYAFKGCSKLYDVGNLTGIMSLGGGAFDSCVSLNSLKFSKALQSVGAGAFNKCSTLKEIDLSMMRGNITIGRNAFDYCASLKVIKFPSITSYQLHLVEAGGKGTEADPLINTLEYNGNRSSLLIDDGAASGFYENVQYLSNYTGCSSLERFELRLPTTTIDDSDIGVLHSVIIEDETTSTTSTTIYYKYDESLRGVTFESSDYTGPYVESGILFSQNWNGRRSTRTLVKIPEAYIMKSDIEIDDRTLVAIRDEAAKASRFITSLTIDKEGLSVGQEAFADCISLTSVRIKSPIEVGRGAFSGLKNVENLIIMGDLTINSATSPFSSIGIDQDNGAQVTFGNETYSGQGLGLTVNDRLFDCSNGLSVKVSSVRFDVGTQKIGSYSFRECGSLRTVYFGKDVQEISEGAFSMCGMIEDITFDCDVDDLVVVANKLAPLGILTSDSTFYGVGMQQTVVIRTNLTEGVESKIREFFDSNAKLRFVNLNRFIVRFHYEGGEEI